MESIELQYVRGEVDVTTYWSHKYEQLDLSAPCRGFPHEAVRLKRLVDEAFWRLDRLNRDDPFWRGTNGLATFTKLQDFAQWEQCRGDAPERAAWIKIALELLTGGEHLQEVYWRPIRDAGELDLDFFVLSAWNTSAYWTDQNVARLALLAMQLDLSEALPVTLQNVRLDDLAAESWVQAVLYRLAAQRI